MNKNMKEFALNAIIAAVYAALTLAIMPIAYGPIQARLSEVMVFLAFYNKRYFPGLIIGCFIANLFSPMGMYDVIFGTLSTAIVCFAMYKCSNKWLAAVAGSVVTGLVIGAELYFALSLPFIINAFYVFVGELIVLLIGVIIFNFVEKNKDINNKYLKES